MTLLGPDQGEQACGDVGPGRLLEPEALVDQLLAGFRGAASQMAIGQDMQGLKVVITSGPTESDLILCAI